MNCGYTELTMTKNELRLLGKGLASDGLRLPDSP
jgi:hypothetical protein